MVPNGYTSECPGPYWSNPPFFKIFDIRALWRSVLSAREPECQKLKNGRLDQYGPERFRRLILPQSEKCGTESVKVRSTVIVLGLEVKSLELAVNVNRLQHGQYITTPMYYYFVKSISSPTH